MIVTCVEFEEQNRGTFEQVVTDTPRLIEQSSDLQRIESESIDGIAQTETEFEGVEATLAEVKKIYDRIYAQLTAEKNDELKLKDFCTNAYNQNQVQAEK